MPQTPHALASADPQTDPASGLPNRALMLRVLDPLLALGRRNARALAAHKR